MKKRKGIILAGGSGTRLYPNTIAVSKQLMPIYDKPMVYYPLTTLMLTGIQEVLIISTPQDLPLFKKLLEDGSQFGMDIQYAEQISPDGLAQALIIADQFLQNCPSALILGDNLFYGNDFQKTLFAVDQHEEGATVFGYKVANPRLYGVVGFDNEGNVTSLEEKPKHPRSSFAVPGLYFYDSEAVEYAKTLKPSKRGELEITDLNLIYMEKQKLRVQLMGRGSAWLDTGIHDDLLSASNFVQVIEKRQGLKIACPEEIAIQKRWINKSQLERSIERIGKSSYAEYLKGLLTN